MSSIYESNTVRIVTVSGRIASGSTTLAKRLSQELGWEHIEGGQIFWEAIRQRMSLNPKDTNLRPDEEDVLFDKHLAETLQNESKLILEAKLAGFNAQGITGVFKILVICEDDNGEDQTQIRIDRLANRDHHPVKEAKEEVLEREKNDLEKWRKLYAHDDPNWTYYDRNYYDLVINTYRLGEEEAFQTALTEFKKFEQGQH